MLFSKGAWWTVLLRVFYSCCRIHLSWTILTHWLSFFSGIESFSIWNCSVESQDCHQSWFWYTKISVRLLAFVKMMKLLCECKSHKFCYGLLNLNHFNLQSVTDALVYQFFSPLDARLGLKICHSQFCIFMSTRNDRSIFRARS